MRDPIREHWERIERWYERYSVAVEGHAELDYQEDLALVVLQNCHAARDWLLHAEPALKDDVLALFDSGELRVCASVANASKHFTLSVPRKDAAKGHPHQNVRFLPRLHVPRRDVVYFRETAEYIALRVGDTERELWNFVRGCVHQIRRFLAAHGFTLYTSTEGMIAAREKRPPFPDYRDEWGYG